VVGFKGGVPVVQKVSPFSHTASGPGRLLNEFDTVAQAPRKRDYPGGFEHKDEMKG
jgi:hypothetical protein